MTDTDPVIAEIDLDNSNGFRFMGVHLSDAPLVKDLLDALKQTLGYMHMGCHCEDKGHDMDTDPTLHGDEDCELKQILEASHGAIRAIEPEWTP